MPLNRPRHQNKEIEAAVQFALDRGWRLKKSNGHIWGQLLCPYESRVGHRTAVFGTPRNKDNAAKNIIRDVLTCKHGTEEK